MCIALMSVYTGSFRSLRIPEVFYAFRESPHGSLPLLTKKSAQTNSNLICPLKYSTRTFIGVMTPCSLVFQIYSHIKSLGCCIKVISTRSMLPPVNSGFNVVHYQVWLDFSILFPSTFIKITCYLYIFNSINSTLIYSHSVANVLTYVSQQ